MRNLIWRRILWSCVFLVASSTIDAADDVVLIDQNRAIAGNVTSGDEPGFPVSISKPGSYRLAGNLTVPDADTSAIVITAEGVTLDVNGFSIAGPLLCPAVGIIGLNARDSSAVQNAGDGIIVDGGGVAIGNVSSSNGGLGMAVMNGTATGNTVFVNKLFGIQANCPSALIGNTVVVGTGKQASASPSSE